MMKPRTGHSVASEVRTRLAKILGEVPFLEVRRWRREAAIERDQVDLVLDLAVGRDPWRLLVEVKTSGEPRMIRGAIHQLQILRGRRAREYGVVAAPFIGPNTQAICVDAGVGCVDLAGNCRLAFDQVFIERRGFPNPRVERRALRSLFAARASRILRVLLEDPKHPWRVQQLAREAGVSLGLAFKVKQRLLDLEYAREADGGIRLAKPEELLRDWANAGPFRGRTELDCYARGDPPEVEAALATYCRREDIRYAFTAFSGAARVAPFTRYVRSFTYVDAEPARVAAELGWKPVPSGANVTLLSVPDDGVWYGVRNVDEEPVVSDIQLYLDLVGSKGRGEEAAAFILEQRLRPRW
jgi:Transcriptional regulator, AbiEi antitoxin, Type IV TA system